MGGMSTSSRQPSQDESTVYSAHGLSEITVDRSLSERGFARYDLQRILNVAEGDEWLLRLQADFDALPADPYIAGNSRFRRYSRAIMLLWTGHLEWLPSRLDGAGGDEIVEYYQGYFNPEHSGDVRHFPSIQADTRENPLLIRLVEFDFAQTFWAPRERQTPIHVGVHLVRLAVHDDQSTAVSSPNCLHQDGERFTFAHSILRQNVVGGANTIAPPECADRMPDEIPLAARLAEFHLEEPLDSYAVHDPQVSHYVSGITKGSGPVPGKRDVILVDFTPMLPLI